MIILRNRFSDIVQKLFGKSDQSDFINTSETAVRDLIKVLAMGYHPRNANIHWLNIASSSILDAGRDQLKRALKVYTFYGISKLSERSKIKLSIDNSKLFKDDNLDFVHRLWKDVYSQNIGGVRKYTSMMNPDPSPQETEEILEKLRYIALRLTGQEKEGRFGWDKKSLRDQIDFNSRRIDNFSKSQLEEELKKIIEEICPGIEFKDGE